MALDEENLKYPTGRFEIKDHYSESEWRALIQIIEEAPKKYAALVSDLAPQQLNRTYREGAWNVAQIVHHVADMQLLHYFRMKKAVTEDHYGESTLVEINRWANLSDANDVDLSHSIQLFSGVHGRFAKLIRSLNEEQLERSYFHSGRKISMNQKQAAGLAAWHVEHHYAHIKLAIA